MTNQIELGRVVAVAVYYIPRADNTTEHFSRVSGLAWF